jgi:hypothetical protein
MTVLRATGPHPGGPHWRFLLSPWRWMLLAYRYDADNDRIVVITIQDARSATAPRSSDG